MTIKVIEPDTWPHTFGPKTETEARTFAEEAMRVDVQILIHSAMQSKGITKEQLAEKMGSTLYHVEKLFTDEYDMTVRELGLVIYALGDEPDFRLGSDGWKPSPLVIK